MKIHAHRNMNGLRLRELRERRQLSQRDLAARCEIGEQQIWRYENGASEPTASQLLKIVRELGVSVDYLLGLTDEPHGYYQGEVLSAFEQSLVTSVRRNDTDGLLTAIQDIAGLLRESAPKLSHEESSTTVQESLSAIRKMMALRNDAQCEVSPTSRKTAMTGQKAISKKHD